MGSNDERDPFAELHHSDPYPPDSLPAASLARIRARVNEETYMRGQANAPNRRTRPAMLVGGVAALMTVLAVAVLAWPRGAGPGGGASPIATPPAVAVVPSAQPTAAEPTGGIVPPPGAASCVEQYTVATLRNRTIAFDGTVTSVRGNDVEFTVNKAFRGVSTSDVTLTAEGMTGTTITSVGGPTLRVGDRYLVAGEDHFAWACGFTQSYDPAVADQWASTFAQ